MGSVAAAARFVKVLTALPVVLLFSMFVPGDAEACSCRGGVFVTSPRNGAVNVPLNAELKLLGFSFGLDASAAKLEREGAVEVPLDVVLVGSNYARLRPTAPLEPSSSYTLSHPDIEPVTFTTATEVDEVPPSSGAAGPVERLDSRLASFGSSCAPTLGYLFTVEPGSDDRSPVEDVWHHVYVSFDGSGGGMTTPFTATSDTSVFFGQSACSNSQVDDRMIVKFVAVDRAGNEASQADSVPAQACGCSSGTTGSAGSMLILVGAAIIANRLRPGSLSDCAPCSDETSIVQRIS